MSTQLKLRRGTTAQHSTFTGASGEITVDTSKKTLVVHDGSTAGGVPLAVDSGVVHTTGNETVGGTKTFSANPVINSGTANGVAYLNGSKVLTTGSALVFDGTNLGIGTSSPASQLDVSRSGDAIFSLTSAGVQRYQLITRSGGNFEIYDQSSAASRVTLSQAGNLGLGVTPSAWASWYRSLDMFGGGTFASSDAAFLSVVGHNVYYNGSNNIYKFNGGASQYLQGSGVHQWYIAPSGTAGNAISFTQAMTLDASGNLGVGTTSPAVRLHVANSGDNVSYFERVGGSRVILYNASGDSYFGTTTNTPLRFATNDTERARIDSSGNLLINRTSQIAAEQFGVGYDGAAKQGAYFTDTSSAGTVTMIGFYKAGAARGSITSTSTATAYNTSSDYRLKENIQPMTGALAKVAALKPCTYKWKADGSDGEGFIAHELAEVCPQAVVGEKDAVDAEGNPVYQGIDTSFLVATLTAAIQEQQAIINQLTARIEALEQA